MNIDINTENLEKELSNLKKTYKSYELTINNIYSLIRESNLYWQDNNAKKFYSDIELNKTEINYSLEVLNEKVSTVQFIYDKYVELGRSIKCNLNYKSNIINKYNSIINISNDILSKYRNLSLDFCPYERNKLMNEKRKIYEIHNKSISMKEKLINYYKKIEQIEMDISKKISNIEEYKINEFNYEEYL